MKIFIEMHEVGVIAIQRSLMVSPFWLYIGTIADDVAVAEDCIVGVDEGDEGPPDSPDLHLHLPLWLWPSNNNITSPGASDNTRDEIL